MTPTEKKEKRAELERALKLGAVEVGVHGSQTLTISWHGNMPLEIGPDGVKTTVYTPNGPVSVGFNWEDVVSIRAVGTNP